LTGDETFTLEKIAITGVSSPPPAECVTGECTTIVPLQQIVAVDCVQQQFIAGISNLNCAPSQELTCVSDSSTVFYTYRTNEVTPFGGIALAIGGNAFDPCATSRSSAESPLIELLRRKKPKSKQLRSRTSRDHAKEFIHYVVGGN
jgi:hypothetical protein